MSESEVNFSDCCGSGCNPCILDVLTSKTNKQDQLLNSGTNCIQKTRYTTFKLIAVENDSIATNLYTFQYSADKNESNTVLFYNVSQHFLLRAESTDGYFTRAYTPITHNTNTKSFTVLIKLIPNGKMSHFLRKLKLNSETLWRGPYGDYMIDYTLRNLIMICQGTGIAPIYSIINNIISNEECETFLKLFYCCKSIDTIHLRNELYKLSSYWNFTYEIFIKQTSDKIDKKYNETIHTKRLDSNYLYEYFRNENVRNNDFQILVCGSEQFSKQWIESLQECDINNNCIYVF